MSWVAALPDVYLPPVFPHFIKDAIFMHAWSLQMYIEEKNAHHSGPPLHTKNHGPF
jgi:hypothetical protein